MADVNFVYNHDVAGVYRRINRFIEEVAHSVSSSGSQMNDYDQTRLATYLDAIDSYLGWVRAQPQLDLPETHPRQYNLAAAPVVNDADVENESAIDVIRMLELARDELINGQSARLGSGLIRFDDARVTAVVEKARRFLEGYIATVTPLDLPESSPMRTMTVSGRGGV